MKMLPWSSLQALFLWWDVHSEGCGGLELCSLLGGHVQTQVNDTVAVAKLVVVPVEKRS